MDDLYSEVILDHFKHPRNFGDLEEASEQIRGSNASCGDVLEFKWQVKGGRIDKVKFKGTGCALSMAAASMLTEKMKGKTPEAVKRITEEEMVKMLGIEVSASRLKCVLLPWKIVQKILGSE